ncbi:MAG: peptidoglycan-binding protein [Frankiales bacterium]|nr:peptidoglycan-binding protein [Frankiales bacterium]
MALSPEELAAESGTALPAKEVMSLLDLNADVNLGLNLAAPVDLAAAANLNVAAPIDAAASANVLSFGSDATSLAPQQTAIDQGITGDAAANSHQLSDLTQGTTQPADTPAPPTSAGSTSIGDVTTGGNLLDVNVNLDANAHIAAPINGAVAANANVAAPIDAGVAANIGSVDSHATALASQTALINQTESGDATANAAQDSNISQ